MSQSYPTYSNPNLSIQNLNPCLTVELATTQSTKPSHYTHQIISITTNSNFHSSSYQPVCNEYILAPLPPLSRRLDKPINIYRPLIPVTLRCDLLPTITTEIIDCF